ncbi:MAG: hypothetical protein ACTTGJ_00155 [Clostridium sp.]
MYKQKKNDNTNNGITLIALVLTIIVLLILAGVALSLALGQNGLIFKSRESKQEQEIAQEKDRIMTAYSASFTNKDGKFNKVTFKDELDKQGIGLEGEINVEENGKLLKFKTKHDEYTVDYEIDNGIIKRKSIGQAETQTTTPIAPIDLKIGDIVYYDPTKGVTDNSKLTYTSQEGTVQTGGNRYGTQTVTAKNTNNEWVVISTANNQIKVISKEPIGDIVGGENNKFTLKGGTGWLYAEEELHKACSVYGHGKGAKKITTTYQIGNKYTEEVQMRTLTGSGARSMTMEDIVKIMKGEQYSDFTEDEKKGFEKYYMNPITRCPETYYLTISSTQENGLSADKKGFDSKSYSITNTEEQYDKDLVTDSKVKESKEKLKGHIFKDNEYWMAFRYINGIHNNRFFSVAHCSGVCLTPARSFRYI